MMFEFQNLQYQSILDIPTLHIDSGVTVLLGASGSGKTTLLKLLNKSISPTSGSVFYHGEDLGKIPSIQHRREVLLLSQQAAMFPGTIADNLGIGFAFQERPIPAADIMNVMLEKVHLKKELTEPVANLSGGEKQRLALARVFLLDPKVYLLDEPSSALDEDTADTVIGLVTEQARLTGRSIVMVTHSTAVASKYADDIVVVKDGHIVSHQVGNSSQRSSRLKFMREAGQ